VAFRWHDGGMSSAVTGAGAHGTTTRMDVHEVARQLNAHLGATLIAAVAGTPDRKLPVRWAKSDGPHPGSDYERRLRLAHRLWSEIAAAEGDHVARAWFIGGNPLLEEDTPITAIREDRAKQVTAAKDAFLEDQSAA